MTQTYGCSGFDVEACERGEFRLHQEAGCVRKKMRDAFGRCVRAVRRSERVVHVDVAERREFFRELRIVLFLFLVKAHVFEQRRLTRP